MDGLGGVFGAFVAVPVVAVMMLIEYYRGLPQSHRNRVISIWFAADLTRPKKQLTQIAEGETMISWTALGDGGKSLIPQNFRYQLNGGP